jgi:hypothetical protein
VSLDGFIEGPDREIDWHLVDEYVHPVHPVHPVLIGRGKPLFQMSDTRQALRLAETRQFGSGVVLLRYER